MDENEKEVIEIRPEDKDFFAEFIDCEGPIIKDSINHKKSPWHLIKPMT